MSEMNIRIALPGDALEIARLWQQCTIEVARLEPLVTPDISEAELTDRLAGELASGTIFAWVAFQEQQLASYVTCRFEGESPFFVSRRYLYVMDLDVAPQFRGRGLSYRMMAEVEAFARENGVGRLELAFVTKDPRPQEVWQRHGFKPYCTHAYNDLD